ncbi:MAG: DUF47 family protein [Deltaproteobacteria bacterium]|nr:DUF47 family protein [Deltaproteobacteria bacterium]
MRLFKAEPDPFIAQMIHQAEIGVSGLEALVAYMVSPGEEHAARVNRTEKEADEVRRMLVEELNRTFVTSIDREDIYALSGAADDLLDYAKSTVEEMTLLKVTPDTHLHEMAQLLLDASREILLALQRLEGHPGVASEHARKAKRVENAVEDTYRSAIAELFNGPADTAQILQILKRREVYRHLSNAADRADQAADIISHIVVKKT